jgi:hypothetical protein
VKKLILSYSLSLNGRGFHLEYHPRYFLVMPLPPQNKYLNRDNSIRNIVGFKPTGDDEKGEKYGTKESVSGRKNGNGGDVR